MGSKLKPHFVIFLVTVTISCVHSQNGYGTKLQPAKSTDEKVKLESQVQPNPIWWMTPGAFQRPKNHPGVEPTEGEATSSNSPPNPLPSVPTPECMLRLKSDCYGGRSISGSVQGDGLPANYQLDGFSTYPVYTAYVVPAIGPFSPTGPQGGSLQPPPQQNVVAYNSDPEATPIFDPNQAMIYPPNYEPPRPQLPSESQPKNQLRHNYKPAVVPYKAPPPTQAQKNSPNANSQTGYTGEETLPYPGCPAAMVCVPEEFCDASGTSAGKPIQLSAAEKLYRVVLAACSAPTTGEVGVCCRDPAYKDDTRPTLEAETDAGQRQGKTVQFDDGQYRPETNGGAQRQGKTMQYDDGQYRPQLHGAVAPDFGAPSYDNGQHRPQVHSVVPQTSGVPSYDNGQYRVQGHSSRQNEPYSAQQQRTPPSPVDQQYQYPQYTQPQYQPQAPQNSQGYPQPQYQPQAPQNSQGYPQPQYQLAPAETSGKTNEGPGIDPAAVLFRSDFPTHRRGFVEECPNSMKCLRASYCQQPNPNEGNTALFDVRVGGIKRATKYKCRQDNLPVDGVCCYLREDYMSSATTRPFSQSIPERLESTSQMCGIRRHKTLAPGTEFGEFPWHALVNTGKETCGGAIISPKIVATTASCLQAVRSDDVTIRVGDWDRSSLSEKKSHQDLRVHLVILHPQFNRTTLGANIAMILTRDPINFDYHAGHICLPQPVTTFQGRRCIVTGWGSLYRSQDTTLQQSDIQVLNDYNCRVNQERGGESNLCGIAVPRQNICLGDEGSPLVCEEPNSGEYALAGFLTDTGKMGSCAKDGALATFTNVTANLDWVYKFVKQNS